MSQQSPEKAHCGGLQLQAPRFELYPKPGSVFSGLILEIIGLQDEKDPRIVSSLQYIFAYLSNNLLFIVFVLGVRSTLANNNNNKDQLICSSGHIGGLGKDQIPVTSLLSEP